MFPFPHRIHKLSVVILPLLLLPGRATAGERTPPPQIQTGMSANCDPNSPSFQVTWKNDAEELVSKLLKQAPPPGVSITQRTLTAGLQEEEGAGYYTSFNVTGKTRGTGKTKGDILLFA